MFSHRFKPLAAAALLCLSSTANAGLLDGLGQALSGLGGALAQTRAAFAAAREQIEAAFAETAARMTGNYLEPTEGTTSFEETVVHQGIGRSSLVIRPEADAPDLAPAVILLHFGRGTPKAMANLAHAGDLAVTHGAWVILPTGENRRWNDEPGSGSGIDDVGYLTKVIETAIARHPIDPQRIYIAGMSNGGFMVSRFVCERAELIAAAAQVVSSMYKSQDAQCAPKQAVPMTLILGSNDPLVHYNAQFGLLSAQQTFARWQKINRCDPSGVLSETLPDLTRDGTRTTLQHNEVCESGAGVQLYTVNGGGHTWPAGEHADSKLRLGRTAHDFAATDVIWDFFKDYTR